ncbi:hypothetical protein G8759_29740 [Spirosoma aureum]|uniref:Uncharacterized protein n=1 Tax=Spirosoma aureum TaxID=2692134 RepID=A0A6G9AVN0_9BACT|nr:hypothetical protein [Spirosoma aureum]QIP16532.1 hypothetical protein G8759_29740 [Spirosoma aureum]
MKTLTADYEATSINSLSFELRQGDELIGKLSYKNWFQFRASIELANHSTYQLIPKGFWGATIELKEADTVLLTFSMNWNGSIALQTYFNAIEKDYLFQHRGVFKESFILLDEEETELVVMKPDVKWSTLNYEYLIQTTDLFASLSNKALLLLTCIHCANYYMSMMAGTF